MVDVVADSIPHGWAEAPVSCRLFKYLCGSYVAVRFVLAKWEKEGDLS